MNDQIPQNPPVPRAPEPAPQYAPQPYGQPPEAYGQPGYPAPVPPQYAAPGGYQGQPNPYGQPQGSHPQQGSYYQQPGQWVPAGPALPRSSGQRVAAGIVEIVLGLWLFFPAILGFGVNLAVLGILFLIASLGNIVAGIVLLVRHRDRAPAAPVTSLTFAGLAVLLIFISLLIDFYGAGLAVLILPVAIPVLIIMGIGLAKEKRGA